MVVPFNSQQRIVILVEEKVNELEAFYAWIRLSEEGADVQLAGRGEKEYTEPAWTTASHPLRSSSTDKIKHFLFSEGGE